MPPTVIYHRADFDGLFSREIAKKFLPSDTKFIGWDWGDPKLPVPEGKFYIIDLSPECLADGASYAFDQCIWIDHHKSAIDKFNPQISGYRIDGVAACRLAWQWFNRAEHPAVEVQLVGLPEKQDYVDRKVIEPYAVRLAGEYDIWDKRDGNTDAFQFGLRSINLDGQWEQLLSPNRKMSVAEIEGLMDVGHTKDLLNPDGTTYPAIIWTLLSNGKLIMDYQRAADALMMQNSFIVEFEGLKFLALNTQAKSSLAFASKDVPETGHDALLKFAWTGKVFDCSMYHARHRTDLDLSAIAIKYGGGGHRGACGMRLEKLPFLK